MMAQDHIRAPVIHLDGRTLEGGGQLVRIAIALSALTSQPITIDNIRCNRPGKKGLKGSHLAAIRYLAQVSGSSTAGAEIGSTSLSFYPRAAQTPRNQDHERGKAIQSHINVVLTTAGSVFLVFQALYPYILHAGAISSVSERRITLSIVGGTNVSFSPSYDYVAQVLVPNFARVGLPRLSVRLIKRGWGTGPFSLGKVNFVVDPLALCKDENRVGSSPQFPPMNIGQYQRGTISQVEITVLAPDDPFSKSPGRHVPGKGRRHRFGGTQSRGHMSRSGQSNDDSVDQTGTIRQFVENETIRSLRKGLKKLPSWIFTTGESSSNAAFCPSRTKSDGNGVLIVAHTSTGFRVGHDALFGVDKGDSHARQARHRKRGGPEAMVAVRDLVERCVEGFLEELYDARLQQDADNGGKRPPCVDRLLRDQLAIFEALGRSTTELREDGREDERYWSLHMQTARWVCEEMLSHRTPDLHTLKP